MPEPVTHTVAYGANDIDSLATLELSCERDEGNLFAKIVKLELAAADGAKATAATYEEVDNFKIGHLTLVEYQTDVDAQSLTAIHVSQGEQFLFKGKAYVKNSAVNVLVFREKPKK